MALIVTVKFGAGNETRTRDPNLGKVVLYQLSYSRFACIFQTDYIVAAAKCEAAFYRQSPHCQPQKPLFGRERWIFESNAFFSIKSVLSV